MGLKGIWSAAGPDATKGVTNCPSAFSNLRCQSTAKTRAMAGVFPGHRSNKLMVFPGESTVGGPLWVRDEFLAVDVLGTSLISEP